MNAWSTEHMQYCNLRFYLQYQIIRRCSPKTESRRQRKKNDFEARFKKSFKGKSPAPDLRKPADKSQSQSWCSHYNTICDVQLQKKIVLRTQPRHQPTLTQPLQCDLQRLSCKTQYGIRNCSSKTGLDTKEKNDFEALFKPYHRQFHCDLRSPCKSHYNVDQGGNPHGCSRYNAICTPELYRRGSQHRREPLCARKHKVSWDS